MLVVDFWGTIIIGQEGGVSNEDDDKLAKLEKSGKSYLYSDPNHPKGYRRLTVKKGKGKQQLTIKGKDDHGEGSSESDEKEWTVKGKKIASDRFEFDFSTKAPDAPKKLLAKFDKNANLQFLDAEGKVENTWKFKSK